jgi:uncharacterized protein (DUF1697 family)
MGQMLLEQEPAFRGAMERCDRAIRKYTGWSMLGELAADEAHSRLDEVDVVQPAIFAVQVSLAELERAIEAKLEQALGFEVVTFLRRASEVRHAASERPFGKVPAGKTHMVAFLRRKPTAAKRKAIEERSTPSDRLVVDGREVHWLIQGRMMDSELKPKDWDVLGQPTTTRNTTMLAKLAEKLDD